MIYLGQTLFQVGPQSRALAASVNLSKLRGYKTKKNKNHFAKSSPPCSVMGENIYVAGPIGATFFTLPIDPEKVRF